MDKVKKLKKFVEKAKEIHGNKYDYSKVDYVDNKTKICIIHPDYGEFFITPKLHLSGDGFIKANGKYTYGYCKFLTCGCNSLRDFATKSRRAYEKSKENGWLKDFTWLKNDIDNNLYKEVKSQWVYSYEFCDNSVYVGLTNDISRRDWQHRNRCYHSNGTPKNDAVLDYSEINNIQIPEVKILEKDLTRKESQISERKFIEQYKKNGWKILNKMKGGSLGTPYNSFVWTKDLIIEEAKKYKTKQEMRNNSRTAYNKMMNMNLGKICFPNGKHVDNMKKRYDYTEDFLREIVNKYPLKKDLRKNEEAVHRWLCKHNRIDEFYPNEVWKKKLKIFQKIF